MMKGERLMKGFVHKVKISKYCSNNAIFVEINHYFCKLELYNGILCPKMKID